MKQFKHLIGQLGLIADDIKDNNLFKYIGSEIVETDASETQVSHLGLKSLPLAIVALTACKNLLQRVEQLENKQN